MTTFNLGINYNFGDISEDEDTFSDCEATLNSRAATKLRSLGSKPSSKETSASGSSTSLSGLYALQCLAMPGVKTAQKTAPALSSREGQKDSAEPSSEFQTARINGCKPDINQEPKFGGKNGANFQFETAKPALSPPTLRPAVAALKPPLLGKRHDLDASGNDQFRFARETISKWVDNQTWPEEKLKPALKLESGGNGYKIQKTSLDSPQGSPLTPSFGEHKKLSLQKSIFQCLGAGDWADGPGGCKSRAPSLGGDDTFTELRKNTQDTIATREYSPMKEEFPFSSSKKQPSFFGADFRHTPFNLDDDDSDEGSSNGNNNPERNHVSHAEAAKKSAKAILFNE